MFVAKSSIPWVSVIPVTRDHVNLAKDDIGSPVPSTPCNPLSLLGRNPQTSLQKPRGPGDATPHRRHRRPARSRSSTRRAPGAAGDR